MEEDIVEIRGGKPLHGSVHVSGAKNAALPILFATLLTSGTCQLKNVPQLRDVYLTLDLLKQFGADIVWTGPNELSVSVPKLAASEASYSLVRSLRASFWVLGPLLARGGAARVAMPGGDVIGARPVDIHIDALRKMGADIRVKGGVVAATAPHGLQPADLDFHFASVGATHQILMAAALTPGTTTINNAASEPEVTAMAQVLQLMGADIEGVGTRSLTVHGKESLDGFSHTVIGDRIEAATFLFGTCAAGGQVDVQGVNPEHLGRTLDLLEEMGAQLIRKPSSISIEMNERPKAVDITTSPFPGFATDNQALFMATAAVADGTSTVEETVYEGRFGHVSELSRMGAMIRLSGQTATIEGVEELNGATVEVRDIRAGAAMVIAGLAAKGRTVIEEGHHLRRGYEHLEAKFRSLGVSITDAQEESGELHLLGC